MAHIDCTNHGRDFFIQTKIIENSSEVRSDRHQTVMFTPKTVYGKYVTKHIILRSAKYVMPVAARLVFQKDVFHPATVSAKLQSHLGFSLFERIFDKYIVMMQLYTILQHILHILHILHI